MAEHSKLPPSSAGRRVVCPGSRKLEELYPEDEESPYAREGHAAHYAAQVALQCFVKNDLHPLNNLTHCNSELITEEMREGAELYACHIYGTLFRLCGNDGATIDKLHIEERVDISNIHPDCWGTPDCWLHVPGQLHIWDYKFGHGLVEVFENWQLIEYAAGIFNKLGFNGIRDQQTRVYFHIVQPRGFHRQGPVRTWQNDGATLRAHFNILIEAERLASLDTAMCLPSPQCSYCTGRHACEALQRAAMDASDMAALNTPLELSSLAVGQELRMLRHAAELLDARITGLSEQAVNSLRKGQVVPHFKLEQSQGRDGWSKDAGEIITMGELYGVPLAKPPTPITPRQAIKAGMPEDVVNKLTVKTQGAMKLVPDNGDEARKIFGGGK